MYTFHVFFCARTEHEGYPRWLEGYPGADPEAVVNHLWRHNGMTILEPSAWHLCKKYKNREKKFLAGSSADLQNKETRS